MAEKKEEPIVEDVQDTKSPSFLFKLSLTKEDKQTIIDILRKDFEWQSEYSSFQIKEYDEHKEKDGKVVSLSFEEEVEAEKKLKKAALAFAEFGVLDAITIALAATWNRRDDFNTIRKIIRKYTIDEFVYYRERDMEIRELSDLFSRIKYTQNYLRPRIGEKKVIIKINGAEYTIPGRRLKELRDQYLAHVSKEEFREIVLAEAVPYKRPKVEEI